MVIQYLRTIVMRYRDFLYACIGGVLLGIGFIVPSLWFFSLFSFFPFLLSVMRERASASRIFSLGLVFGFIAYGLSFSPNFWGIFPLTWLGINNLLVEVLGVGFIWSSTVLVFALCSGLYALVFRLVMTNSWFDIFLASSGWILADWLGAWLFSLVNAGSATLYGSHFTIGSFGYLLAD